MTDKEKKDSLQEKRRFVRSLTGSGSYLDDEHFLTPVPNDTHPRKKKDRLKHVPKKNKQAQDKDSSTAPDYY
jgi:hypothetical protein